ncbi:MAG: hypothetical protein P4L56_30075 [Candidatus Sulfopaludibacter sp.]|nr:hypothetical protein [Candidatus Sulfopaludibacter sp.]
MHPVVSYLPTPAVQFGGDARPPIDGKLQGDFSFISSNWRGEPLRDFETVVRLIAGTTTAKGLKVTCRLDHRKYPVGRKITVQEFAHFNLRPDEFHGEWNYTILPNK